MNSSRMLENMLVCQSLLQTLHTWKSELYVHLQVVVGVALSADCQQYEGSKMSVTDTTCLSVTEESTEERVSCQSEGTPSSKQDFWIVIAAFWLFAIVLVFVAIQISRTSTPISDWANKMIHLLTVSR
jgi:hypothetical protein